MILSTRMAQDFPAVKFYSAAPGAVLYQDQATLDKFRIPYQVSQRFSSTFSHLNPRFNRRVESQNLALARVYDHHRIRSAALRPGQRQRPKLRLIIHGDTNFQCHIKGCGRTFDRNYMFKAHLAKHDTSRYRQFACSFHDCTKIFARKVDLQRHYSSVHMRERKHCCIFCNRSYARKDTLRR